LERYRNYVRRTAERFGLRYEEVPGSAAFVKKVIHGPRDDEFVVVPPDQIIQFKDFFPTASSLVIHKVDTAGLLP